MIWGLTKYPGFNGLHGTVQSLDQETGRGVPRNSLFVGWIAKRRSVEARRLAWLARHLPHKHPGAFRDAERQFLKSFSWTWAHSWHSTTTWACYCWTWTFEFCRGYNVQLSSADGSNGQSAKIKGENLRMYPARITSVIQSKSSLSWFRLAN